MFTIDSEVILGTTVQQNGVIEEYGIITINDPIYAWCLDEIQQYKRLKYGGIAIKLEW